VSAGRKLLKQLKKVVAIRVHRSKDAVLMREGRFRLHDVKSRFNLKLKRVLRLYKKRLATADNRPDGSGYQSQLRSRNVRWEYRRCATGRWKQRLLRRIGSGYIRHFRFHPV
jgi:hypothetical protein